jgi:hypothetical protein
VRPSRDNIAAPEFPGRIPWLNRDEPPRMSELTATGPVLVHFFDFAQLNSVRALPYVLEWNRRYSPLGLTVLGIHSPRFRFSGERETATAGIAELGVGHPVALDSDYAIWHDYGCKGWPSLFLWRRGGALAWAHFGEGEYRETEDVIQAELRGDDLTLELPPPMEPLRATDAPGALVAPPSEEIFPGGSPAEGWEPGPGDDRIEVEYEAGGAYVVAERGGALRAGLDGAALEPVCGSGLIPLAEHPRHERHRLTIEATPGARVWAISFAPGMPS